MVSSRLTAVKSFGESTAETATQQWPLPGVTISNLKAAVGQYVHDPQLSPRHVSMRQALLDAAGTTLPLHAVKYITIAPTGDAQASMGWTNQQCTMIHGHICTHSWLDKFCGHPLPQAACGAHPPSIHSLVIVK
jgi:hypothetical protein